MYLVMVQFRFKVYASYGIAMRNFMKYAQECSVTISTCCSFALTAAAKKFIGRGGGWIEVADIVSTVVIVMIWNCLYP